MNDTSALLPFDEKGIKGFIVDRDRVINPFFVGRDDIIALVNDCLMQINTRHLEKRTIPPAKGLMQLVQGAPGIGKTVSVSV